MGNRRALSLAALLLAASSLVPADAGAGPLSLFREDRLKHLFTSLFAASVAASVAQTAGLEAREAAWVGAAASVGAGLLKEWRDARRGGRADPLDLGWGVLGAGAAVLVLREAR
ncbi:MAG: hypothetical protein HY702_08430 [Gemmatimonadetes bacterium]|nr:hypothetical protein [Gemmatimonadota bacterium]